MKWLSLLVAVVLCVPLHGGGSVAYSAAVDTSPAAADDCADFRKKLDIYDALLAAGFLTLLQLDGQVSDALEAYNNAVEAANLAATLYARMEQFPDEYTPLQRARAGAEKLYRELVASEAKAALDQLDAKRAATEKYLIDIAALRTAVLKYLDDHCGGVKPPGGGVPVPVPDPNI